MVPVLILAAGASTRMRGADKLLQTVLGEPLLRRQVRIAGQSRAPVLVTLPPQAVDRRQVLQGLPAELIEVADAASGMASSLRAGVKAVADAAGLLVLLADMPEIEAEDLALMQRLFAASANQPILRATSATGQPGHPVLFPARCFAALVGLEGDQGARALLGNDPEVEMVPLPGLRAVTDLDTPEAWAEWRARTGR